jgi:hypothetical protein
MEKEMPDFKFDLDTAEARQLGPCGAALAKSQKNAKKGKATCLQIPKECASTEYLQHCVDTLSILPGNDAVNPSACLFNYGSGGALYPDLLVALLKQLGAVISRLDNQVSSNLIKMIKPPFKMEVLCHFAPEFKTLLNVNNLTPIELKNESVFRSQLASELLNLITLYCKHAGALVIVIANIDALSPNDRNFLGELLTFVNLLRLIGINEKSKVSFVGVAVYEESMGSILRDTLSKLIKKHLNFTVENEADLVGFILSKRLAVTANQAQLVIQDIAKIVGCHSSNNSPDDDGEQSRVDLEILAGYYLLPAEATRASVFLYEDHTFTLEERRVHDLCVFLGPYVKRKHLEKIFEHFYKISFPSGIDFSRLLLIEVGEIIRHKDLATYDLARTQLKKYKHYKKIVAGVQGCSAARHHVYSLAGRSDRQSRVMGLRIDSAIASIYGLDANQNPSLERGLSSSSEMSVHLTDVALDSSDYKIKELEIIFDCADTLITSSSAVGDIKTASMYCEGISALLADFHGAKYKAGIEDTEIAGMILSGENSNDNPTRIPYGDLNKKLYVRLVKLLINMYMFYYFNEQYQFMREKAITGYQLGHLLPETEKLANLPIIEASLAVSLTLAAEALLRDRIKAELDNEPEKQRLLNDQLQRARQAITKLVVTNIPALLRDITEGALAACELGGIAANLTVPRMIMAGHLRAAYRHALQKNDNFKGMLALGNALLLELGAGVPFNLLKEPCTQFIRQCKELDVMLPVPIIQSLLELTDYYDKPTENINVKTETVGPNCFFMNTLRLMKIFLGGDNQACVRFSDAMQPQEFSLKNNIRIGYCIYPDFLLIRAIALLRHIENRVEEQTDAHIREIFFALRIFEQYASDCPVNFGCRNQFLIAVVRSSKLSQRISGLETLSPLESVNSYAAALSKAGAENNQFYRDIILIAFQQAQVHLLTTTTNVVEKSIPQHLQSRSGLTVVSSSSGLANRSSKSSTISSSTNLTDRPSEPSAVSSSTSSANKAFDELVDRLKDDTALNLSLLFIKDSKGGFTTVKIISCPSDIQQSLATFIKNKAPVSTYWDQGIVDLSVKQQRLVCHNSASKKIPPFLMNKRIENVIAIPISVNNRDNIQAVLYLHSLSAMNFTEANYRKLKKLAIAIYNAVQEDSSLVYSGMGQTSSSSHAQKSSEASSTSLSSQFWRVNRIPSNNKGTVSTLISQAVAVARDNNSHGSERSDENNNANSSFSSANTASASSS